MRLCRFREDKDDKNWISRLQIQFSSFLIPYPIAAQPRRPLCLLLKHRL